MPAAAALILDISKMMVVVAPMLDNSNMLVAAATMCDISRMLAAATLMWRDFTHAGRAVTICDVSTIPAAGIPTYDISKMTVVKFHNSNILAARSPHLHHASHMSAAAIPVIDIQRTFEDRAHPLILFLGLLPIGVLHPHAGRVLLTSKDILELLAFAQPAKNEERAKEVENVRGEVHLCVLLMLITT